MKTHITRKDAHNMCDYVFAAGYCELQDIMGSTYPRFYNAGIYGWNWDMYTVFTKRSVSVGITTGYRNTTGTRIPSEIVEKYKRISKEIYEHYRAENKVSYDDYLDMMANMRFAFAQELVSYQESL